VESVERDVFPLAEHFKDHPQPMGMNNCKLLFWYFKRQCHFERDEVAHQLKVSIILNREVYFDFLQNSSDHDVRRYSHERMGIKCRWTMLEGDP
jgi:hypothetical protein